MSGRSLAGFVAGAVAVLGLLAAPANGAAPTNDHPETAMPFSPYTAPNGVPTALQGFADLTGATADRGIPRCLGPASFSRTVWYRVPEAPGPTQLTVEASGRTTAV